MAANKPQATSGVGNVFSLQSGETDLLRACKSGTMISSTPPPDPYSFDSSSKCVSNNALFANGIVTSPSSVISYYPSEKKTEEFNSQTDLSFNDQESSVYNLIPTPNSSHHLTNKVNTTPKKKRRRQKSDSSESVSSMGSPDGSPRMLKKIGRVIQTTQSEKDLDTKVDYLLKNIMQKFLTKEKDTLELNTNADQENCTQNKTDQVSPRKIKSKKQTITQNACEDHCISKIHVDSMERLDHARVQFPSNLGNSVSNSLPQPFNCNTFGVNIKCSSSSEIPVTSIDIGQCFGKLRHPASFTASSPVSAEYEYNQDVLDNAIQQATGGEPSTRFAATESSKQPHSHTANTREGYKAAVQKYEDFMKEQQKHVKKPEIKCTGVNVSAGEKAHSSPRPHSFPRVQVNSPSHTQKEQTKNDQVNKLQYPSEKLSEYDLHNIAQLLKGMKDQYYTEFYKQLMEFSAGQNPDWLVNYPNVANLLGLGASTNDSKYDKALQILQYLKAMNCSSSETSANAVRAGALISSTSMGVLSQVSPQQPTPKQHSVVSSTPQCHAVCPSPPDTAIQQQSHDTVSLSSHNKPGKYSPRLNGTHEYHIYDNWGPQNSSSLHTQVKGSPELNYTSSASILLSEVTCKPDVGHLTHHNDKNDINIKREIEKPNFRNKQDYLDLGDMNDIQHCNLKTPKTEEKMGLKDGDGIVHGIPNINIQTSPLVNRLKNNTQEEIPECDCMRNNSYDDHRDGPYYTHLGAGKTVSEVREIMEKRLNMSGEAIRIEKVLYTGKEGRNPQGCPIAKWVIRRSGVEEKVLVLVRPRRGHNCATSVIVIGICVWEGVQQRQADVLYDYLRNILPKYGFETERRCGTNEKRTCACQGWDGDSAGASFTFGCSWSMYYNGCKFCKSTTPRKFKLKNQDEETRLESTLQTLATQLGPLYKKAAPDSYKNMVEFESLAKDCRLGYEPGQPFSGVTAVVDFSTHAHKDQHNMNNGCTMVVTLTKHRGLSKPQDEQLHVLPLCVMDTTDETGNLERQYEKIRNGSIEYLTKYPMKMRVRAFPLPSCKQRKKLGKAGGRGRGRGRKAVQNWLTSSAKKVGWNSLYGGRGRGRNRSTFSKKLGSSSQVLSKPPKLPSTVKQPPFCKNPYSYSVNRASRVFKSTEGYKYRILPDGRRMKLKPGRPLPSIGRHMHEVMGPHYINHGLNAHMAAYGHNVGYGLPRDSFCPNYHPPVHGHNAYPPARNPLGELSASQRGFYYKHIQWEQFYRRKKCEDYMAQFGVAHPYLAEAMTQVEKQVIPQVCEPVGHNTSHRPAFSAPTACNSFSTSSHMHPPAAPLYNRAVSQQSTCSPLTLPSQSEIHVTKPSPQSQNSNLTEHGVPPNKSVFDINSSVNISKHDFHPDHRDQPVKQEHSVSDTVHLEPHFSAHQNQAANSHVHLDSSLPSFGRTFMTSQVTSQHEDPGDASVSPSVRQHFNTSHHQVTSGTSIAQDSVHKGSPSKQLLTNPDLSRNEDCRQQSIPVPVGQHSDLHTESAMPSHVTVENAQPACVSSSNNQHSGEGKPLEAGSQLTDPLAGAKEVYTECDENFMESDIGGVGIALTHGSVLFEVAKRELHATTAMKKPNRYEPTRISLVFYQHKNLNAEKHGYHEYLKKSEIWKQRRENKSAADQQSSFIPVNPPAPTRVVPSNHLGAAIHKEVKSEKIGQFKGTGFPNEKHSMEGVLQPMMGEMLGPNGKHEIGEVLGPSSMHGMGEVGLNVKNEITKVGPSVGHGMGEAESGSKQLTDEADPKVKPETGELREGWLRQVSIRNKTQTSNTVHYTWLKPQLAVTGPYQRWY